MSRNNSKTIDEVQIRQPIDCWACAIRDKNIEAAVFHYTRDILLYDLAPPLAHRGVDVYKKELAEWFATFQGAVGFEVHAASGLCQCSDGNRHGGSPAGRPCTPTC